MTYSDCKLKVLKLLNKGFSVKCYLVRVGTLLVESSFTFEPWFGFIKYDLWKRHFCLYFDTFLLGRVPVSCIEDFVRNVHKIFFYFEGGDDNGKCD